MQLWMLAGLVVDGPDQLARLLDQRPILARYLALLMLAGPNPPTVGELAERLDSKPSPATVANELRRLRHALGEGLLARLDPRSTIPTADKPVRLRLEPDSADLGRVRQRHALARQLLPTQPEAAVNEIRAALSEWSTSEDVAAARRAYPLSDEHIRERLEEERRSVRLTYGEALLCLGDVDEAEAEFSAVRATRQELGELLARPSCSGLDVRIRRRILSCGRAGSTVKGEPDVAAPAAASACRTRRLIGLLQIDAGAELGYEAPAGFVERVRAFLSSSDRVFVLEGGLGLGKTSFCLYLPGHVPDGVVCQLHTVPGFDPIRETLAATILRYADVPLYAADAIADLERLLSTGSSEWLFIIDGISSVEEWHSLCRDRERILFRIDSPRIKFFVTRRPLPGTYVSQYPLLSATLSRPSQQADGPSWKLAPWTEVATGLAVVAEQCSVCGSQAGSTELTVQSGKQSNGLTLPQEFIGTTARESVTFICQSGGAAVEPVVLEQLHADVSRLAVTYLTSPPANVFLEARNLRDQAFGLIRDHRRPTDSRDLHLIAGQLCGILAYASLDLGYADEAMTQARAAWFCADVAGHYGLKAWVRGTQSLIARFMGSFSDAHEYIQLGVKYATEGTSLVRLKCGEAQCLAHFEDSTGTHQALNQAKDARDKVNSSDAIGGLFAFSEAKQSYYAGSSLIWLTGHKDARIAEAESINAIQLWRAGPNDDRSHADEALAHIYLGTARVHLGDLDGVLEAIRPVLGIPRQQRVSWHKKRLGRISEMLDTERYWGSALADRIRGEIEVFSMEPVW